MALGTVTVPKRRVIRDGVGKVEPKRHSLTLLVIEGSTKLSDKNC